MTERIDQTGRAENAMQNGVELRNAGMINDATFQATLAQASATLALVEQQRIANQIAIAVAIRGDLELGASASELSDWLNDGGGVTGYFSIEEQEALGLS